MINLFFPDFLVQHFERNYEEESNNSVKNVSDKKCLSKICNHSANCDICKTTKQNIKNSDVEFLLSAHEAVKDSGVHNFEGCRIPINTNLNIQYMRSMLIDYKDYKICDFFEFGFPLGYLGDDSILVGVDKKNLWKYKNHKGAEEFPNDMLLYLKKESQHRAILGPFKANPFNSGIKISPLNTVPKGDICERRVILDLIFPKGASINEFISKEFYLDRCGT